MSKVANNKGGRIGKVVYRLSGLGEIISTLEHQGRLPGGGDTELGLRGRVEVCQVAGGSG